LKFNRQFFRDFWLLLKPYWSSEEKWRAFALLGASVLCIIIGVRASIAVNTFNKDFFNALQNFDKAALINSLLHFSVIVVVFVCAYGYAFYFNGLLSVRWRRWLTENCLKKWLDNHTHYHMQLKHNSVDNPDQRISEDLEQFPELTLSVFSMLFRSSLTLISFGYILWNLSGSLSIPVGAHHIVIPGYLFWGSLLYTVLGTWIVGLIGKKLAGLDYQQQRFNADFRFSLARMRETGEQIALYQGESAELNKFDLLFGRIFNNYTTLLRLRKRLMFFTNGYDVASLVFGIFLAVPLYLQKKIQLGGMMQISSAFGQVIGAFSVLINGFGLFAQWRAVIFRLTEFNQSINRYSVVSSGINVKEHHGNDIVIQHLKLSLPDGRLLLDDINLVLPLGGSFLLSGRSGLGKSTLLRALAGLWLYGEGQIALPKNKKLFFLPQKPYLPLGSLKEVLVYPHNCDIDDRILVEALKLCALAKFEHRLTEVRNWAQELSLGEQQLIAFARIFVSKPDIIFLDEATSALDELTEAQVYRSIRKMLPQATIVSVGHRNSLSQFHEQLITLAKHEHSAVSSKSELATV